MTLRVAIAAGGAAWEGQAVAEVERLPGLALSRRCVDVADLLGAVAAEVVDAAVVSPSLPGLDLEVVDRLRRAGLTVVAMREGDPDTAARLGLGEALEVADLHRLDDLRTGPADPDVLHGRLIAVWGPTGAPGRSAVALTLASALAAHGTATVLVDADVEGGAQAQAVGLLADVSGLVAAARAANRGRAAQVVDELQPIVPGLRLLTGLPRADMASQIHPVAYDAVLSELLRAADVVVADCGFSLDADVGRGAVSAATLERADEIVVVGRADPLGLARLVRALHDLAAVAPGRSPRVLVNHARRSLGWNPREVDATIARLTGITPEAHLPWDQAAWDAAAIAGRLPREAAPSSPFVARVEAFASSLARRASHSA